MRRRNVLRAALLMALVFGGLVSCSKETVPAPDVPPAAKPAAPSRFVDPGSAENTMRPARPGFRSCTSISATAGGGSIPSNPAA